MDVERLRASWGQVSAYGAQVPQYFYARLFLENPHLREMFPVSMAAQSDRLVGALGRVVSSVDNLPAVVPVLQQLGRDHRKFAVREEHFPMVGEALLATLAHFLRQDWSPNLEADWTEAFTVVAATMIEAAAAAERVSPPWWEAEVVAHERRGFDIALLRLRPQPAYTHRAGQSITVETPMRPRVWRPYSPANAPRADGTIDLHVKAVPGGQVSNALVNGVVRSDVLRLGSPVGTRLTLDTEPDRDLLLLAGGTGVAPLKAVVEAMATAERPRRVTFFVGARTLSDLYDLPSLERMAQQVPWLTVVPVLSHELYYRGERGNVTEVALRYDRWQDHDVYLCGPDGMVADGVARLVAAGVPLDRVRTEDFNPDAYRAQDPAGATMEVRTL